MLFDLVGLADIACIACATTVNDTTARIATCSKNKLPLAAAPFDRANDLRGAARLFTDPTLHCGSFTSFRTFASTPPTRANRHCLWTVMGANLLGVHRQRFEAHRRPSLIDFGLVLDWKRL